MDRLIDSDPNNQAEVDSGQHQKLKELRQSVRRDLENLFNTRIRLLEPEEKYSQLKFSILNYGLPDLATVNLSKYRKASRVCPRNGKTSYSSLNPGLNPLMWSTLKMPIRQKGC